MACEQIFFNKLRERGFRLTPQREMVLSVMHQLDGLATAEEIFARVQSLSSAVDISTVYRTLDLLGEFDLVCQVDPGDGQRRYELVGVHGLHIHLVCRACGKIFGVDVGPAHELAAFLKAKYDFQVDLEHLSVPGLCSECRNVVDGK